MDRIYLDYAATTYVKDEVLEAMKPYYKEHFGNPSSMYESGRYAKNALDKAREDVAKCIGAKYANEVYFTACGTESDNWALKGMAFMYPGQKKRIVTSEIEHHAVLNTCAFLEMLGYEVVYLPVDRYGLVSSIELEKAITDDTVLVSIMMANNEVGTIEPIAELAETAHRCGVPFHTDAVQALGHVPININGLNIDMLSASAHKFNGPKGTGFLYVKSGVKLHPLLHGGGQENSMRSGTENVGGIVGMGAALQEHMDTMQQDADRLEALRSMLIALLRKAGLDFIVNGSERHIPGSLSVSFRGVQGEMLLHRLDLMNIAVATGSACNSKETTLSHVIKALKIPSEYANGTIRITLGMDNDEEQIKAMADSIVRIIG